MRLTALPGGGNKGMETGEHVLEETGALLAGFGFFGIIWMDTKLSVQKTYGKLVDFVQSGRPVTESVLPIFGLENEILELRDRAGRLLELPAVSVARADGQSDKLNFTFFWNTDRGCPMALAYKSTAQTELEVELSKQIRARLMAEAEVTAKSKELARANADLESFAAIVSHDLKAPLRHMRQLTETAFDQSCSSDPAALREMLRQIDTQSRRMSGMLTALLDYSTLGRKYEALELVDTRGLVEAIVTSLPASGLKTSLSGQWTALWTLRAPLDLALRNVISNAIQHHDREFGEIHINCSDQPQAVIFAISDDGPGIDHEHHDAIFLPFRTIGATSNTQSTGMGLAAVQKALEATGGSIEVASEPQLRRGTTFTVTWPKAILT